MQRIVFGFTHRLLTNHRMREVSLSPPVQFRSNARSSSFALQHLRILCGRSRLRRGHYASHRQQHQSVVGAPRRRAAPGSQSVELGALPRFGQRTSSSTKPGGAMFVVNKAT